jgi:hypothetical protein
MLKQKIDKAAYDALPDVMKAEYRPNPTNAAEYMLDAEDAREAIAARDREKLRADGLQASIDAINVKLAAADKAKQDAIDDAARKGGDTAALDKSWQAKLDAAIAAHGVEKDKLTAQLRTLLVLNEATRIANEISTVPELIVDRIAARLSADLTGDIPITRVLDEAGKPSASSVAELQKEFVANPKFASIIRASKGSGGGADGGGSGGGAPGGVKFSQLSEAQKVAWSKTDPVAFKKASDAHIAEQRAARG